MKHWYISVVIMLIALSLAIGVPAIILQVKIDKCLDGGGKFMYEVDECENIK